MYDFKKTDKKYYTNSKTPELITLGPVTYLAIDGAGNPNEENGYFKQAVEKLYSVMYAIKMSYKKEVSIPNFYEFVVPPLEGYWWMEDIDGINYQTKENFSWILMLRVPDFVNELTLSWAKNEVTKKKKCHPEGVYLRTDEEGLCVQMLHTGSFDDEPATVEMLHEYAKNLGYEPEINSSRHHREIYLTDSRKTEPTKQKTIIRHPVKRIK